MGFGQMEELVVTTQHCDIFVRHSQNQSSEHKSRPTCLFIHGNSSSSRIFLPIFESRIADQYPIIAFDLPGHGSSSNALDPHLSYTQAGYADVALTVLEKRGVKEVIVFGWSLGGHTAIEMASRLSNPAADSSIRLRGVMIVGTPPSSGLEQVTAGFKGSTGGRIGLENLDDEGVAGYVSAMCGNDFGGKEEPWMSEDVRRTDGRARKRMWEAFTGAEGCDQREVVKKMEMPIAVVNGAEEQCIHLDYVYGVEYGRLWEGKCHRLEGYGHNPFWEDQTPAGFQRILERFAADCSGNG